MRRGGPADATAIRDLTRAAYRKWVAVIGREPLPMAVDYVAALASHRFDLIECDGQLAALIETVVAADHLLIENLAVAPEFQGRGFGRVLMAQAEALARDAGLSEVRLYTNPAFAGNVRFYQQRGYRIDREEPFRGGLVTYMSKAMGRAGA